MKANLFLLGFLVFSTITQAQISSLEHLHKSERKALKKELIKERESEVSAMLQDASFIIQVDRFGVSGPFFGNSVKSSKSVPSNWNTLIESDSYSVKIDQGVINLTTGLSHQSRMPEDFGSTLQGEIRELKIKPFRNFSRIRFLFSTSQGQYQFEGRITNVGYASGYIENISSHSRMDFQGDLNSTSTAN